MTAMAAASQTVPACHALGRGPETVLFLHGIGGDHTLWAAQQRALAGRFRTLAWDMPGYGGSAALTPMTFPALARAVLRLLDAQAVGRVHLVGHSMGGMIAQEFALLAPQRLASLVLSATTAAFGPSGGDWQRRFLAERLKPLDDGLTPADIAPAVVAGLVGEGPDAAAVDAAVAAMSRVPAKSYRAALHCLVEFDRRAALGKIAVPTLLIAGEVDRVAPAKAMARMAADIASSRLVILPAAGHLANLEQPAAFNAALIEFYAALPAIGAGHGSRARPAS